MLPLAVGKYEPEGAFLRLGEGNDEGPLRLSDSSDN